MTTKKATVKKSVAKKKSPPPTPEQIAWNIPLGVAMEAYFGDATDKDFRLKNKISDALVSTLKSAPKGATSKHFFMAVLDLARSAVLHHVEQVKS